MNLVRNKNMKRALFTLALLSTFYYAMGSISAFAEPTKKTITTEVVTDRSTNISVNPLGFLIGAANVSAQFKVSERFSIGPSASFYRYSVDESKATGYGLGLDAVFYLSGTAFNDSWFLGPFLGYANASNGGLSASGVGVGATIGYWWFWDSGFNLSLGIGIQYVTIDFSQIGLGTLSGTLPAAQFSIGYAF